ncbi:stalk domain-containing protein [Syntrophomonas wolfei]|jgi:hypothetical protein|uniref:Uncharacterized protein n=1 Tax=Syntrophomonas wolfei TaxID=863 RepID=A0A354YSW3_9FIRM|nr:stalk domain-containing protein [Syntrophomonas wolfei]HBK52410.1 hypothetical protein [Syntrophomonas wolfei]
MKSKSFLFTLLLALLFGLAGSGIILPALAAETQPVKIFVDGRQVDPGEAAPFIKNDRVMVPLRVISEGLGLKVDWDAENYRVLISSSSSANLSSLPADGKGQFVQIYFDGREIKPDDVSPLIVNDRTMVPLRSTFEGMGMKVDWDDTNYQVIVMTPQARPVDSSITPVTPVNDPPAPLADGSPQPAAVNNDYEISIMGDSSATPEQLKALLQENNPLAPDLVELYLQMGREYGVRGDIAFCQAAKETGWWKFGGLALPEQNNYCGLSVTGKAATATEDLRGANPQKVRFIEGKHGAFFDSPANGVEAHIQHLYAYATAAPLPAGKELLDPRFILVNRGCAPRWIDLGGKWATPGFDRNKYSGFAEAFAAEDTYGHSILANYYWKALPPATI